MVLHNFLQHLHETLAQNAVVSLPPCKENPLEIEFEVDHDVETLYPGSGPSLPFANSDEFNANILGWRRLTALDEACKDVYEISLDVQGSNFDFKAGDTIGIIPQNNASDVSAILTHLGLNTQANYSYKLSVNSAHKGKLPLHVPCRSTLRHVFTHCVDLRCVLKKLFLLAISRHTKEETERRILEFLCSKEGSSAYQTHIVEEGLTLLDLFTTFRSCKPPVQVLLAHLPRLLPRPYSIVNSGLIEAKVLKICFSVIKKQNLKKGLVTGWLENTILKKEQDVETTLSKLSITNYCDTDVIKVPIYLRKNISGFSLPESIEPPLILIGPGTGIAPFIGFLQERELFMNKNPDIKPGEVWLFYGCRNPKLDFIYEKELNEFLDRGVLNKLCTAFSRVEDSNTRYIQDALTRNSNEISQLIDKKALIFVCGDLNTMVAQVKETLIQCLVYSRRSLEEAKEVICDMQKEKRYIVDAWS